MKIYIKSSNNVASLDAQIRNYLGDNLISASDWYDGTAYIFKINNHNIYRVIVFPDKMVFQCTQYAIVDKDGDFVGFDEAVDYKCTEDTKEMANNPSTWFDLFKQWIDECEADDPNFTIYEELSA